MLSSKKVLTSFSLAFFLYLSLILVSVYEVRLRAAITHGAHNGAIGLATTLTGVNAGDLVVCMITVWDDTGTPTLSNGTTGPDGYSNRVNNSTGGQQAMRFAYYLSSVQTGSLTYTWSGVPAQAQTMCYRMNHAGAMTLDTANSGATAATATAASANTTSAEVSMVAFGGAGYYNAESLTSATLDSVSVDNSQEVNDVTNQDYGIMTMRIMNNPGTYNSTVIVNTAATNVADVIAFKEAATGGTRCCGGLLRGLPVQ